MTYQIADEPVETPWRHLVVRPSMPLLASMMCGAWLAWPWFAFNAIAMGSPTRRKEVALCVAAFVSTTVLAVIVIELFDLGWIPKGAPLRLALLGLTAYKLAFCYYLELLQSRTFHVYEYYGGQVRASGGVLTAAYWLRGFVVGLSDDPLWIIIVAGGI